jgi:hypothetical protein
MLEVLKFRYHNVRFGEGSDMIWEEKVTIELYMNGTFVATARTDFKWDQQDEQILKHFDTSGTWKVLSKSKLHVTIELRRFHSLKRAIITLRENTKSLFITIPCSLLWEKDSDIELALDDHCIICSDDICCWRCKNDHTRFWRRCR